MTTAYIVIGKTGSPDGGHTWHVKAFVSAGSAEALVSRLNTWCVENGADPVSNTFERHRDDKAFDEATPESDTWMVAWDVAQTAFQENWELTRQPGWDEAFEAFDREFTAKHGPNPYGKRPAEDPDFRCDFFGTKYEVLAMVLE